MDIPDTRETREIRAIEATLGHPDSQDHRVQLGLQDFQVTRTIRDGRCLHLCTHNLRLLYQFIKRAKITRDTKVAQDIRDSQEFLAPQAFQDFQAIRAIPIRDIHPIKETIIIPDTTTILGIIIILVITIMEMEIIIIISSQANNQVNNQDSPFNQCQCDKAATTIHGELQRSNRLTTN